MEEVSQAQRGEGACPRMHSPQVAEPGCGLRSRVAVSWLAVWRVPCRALERRVDRSSGNPRGALRDCWAPPALLPSSLGTEAGERVCAHGGCRHVGGASCQAPDGGSAHQHHQPARLQEGLSGGGGGGGSALRKSEASRRLFV